MSCAAKAAVISVAPALTIAGVGRDQRQQPGFDIGGRAVGAVVVVLLVQPASASSAARLSKRKDIGWNKRGIGIFSPGT